MTSKNNRKINDFLAFLILIGFAIAGFGTIGAIGYTLYLVLVLNYSLITAIGYGAVVWFTSVFVGAGIALITGVSIEIRDERYRQRAWKELQEEKELREETK